MEFRIAIPDEKAARVLDALAQRHGYDADTGQTKQQFVRERIKQWIRDEVREHEANVAAAVARRNVTDLEI